MRSATERTHCTLLSPALSASWLHPTSQSYLFRGACKCICYSEPVQKIDRGNKPDIHISCELFPRLYSLTPDQGSSTWRIWRFCFLSYSKGWLTEHLNFCKFAWPLSQQRWTWKLSLQPVHIRNAKPNYDWKTAATGSYTLCIRSNCQQGKY